MAAGLDSSKIRDAAVVQDPLVRDRAPDLDLDHVVGRALVQEAVAVLVATAVVAPVPSRGHTQSPSPSLNPNLPSVAVHAQNPNQETAQSRNLSQSPNPDLVLGPRLRGQSPGRSPNPKPSLPQRIGRAASVPEVIDPDPDQEANTARAVAALVRP